MHVVNVGLGIRCIKTRRRMGFISGRVHKLTFEIQSSRLTCWTRGLMDVRIWVRDEPLGSRVSI
jgi:hypothetical protein